MIRTVTSLDTVIDGIEEITVESIVPDGNGARRVVIVRTKHNENYYLRLHGETEINLQLRRDQEDQDEDWLTPKVYNGTSMTEEDEENDA